MRISEVVLNIRWKKFSKLYKGILKNPFSNYHEIRIKQLNELKEILLFAKVNIPFYGEHLKNINLKEYSDINNLLAEIPIINKRTIKENSKKFKRLVDFKKEKIYNMTTGGSTGEPLHYEIGYEDLQYSRLLKYRGFNYGGYNIGDPLIIVGGGSLINKNNFITKLKAKLLRTYKFSSYKINDEVFEKITQLISSNKKIYIYGYASTIYLISQYILRHDLTNLKINIKAVYPTSEVLHDFQRLSMESAFGDCIFNDYGVNDGGVSAHECEEHSGLHLDTERSIVEIIDDEGKLIKEGIGKVVTTSLKNYAMPFIRYETGDIAEITHKPCKCGRNTPRLIKIFGRTIDYLKINEDYIGSPVLTVLMGKLDIEMYQIIQTTKNHIIFKVYKTSDFTDNEKQIIKKHINESIFSYYTNLVIDVDFYDTLPKIDNKYKFIINKYIETKNNE